MYINATFSIRPTLSFPRCVHKFILHIWVSISSLQIGVYMVFIVFLGLHFMDGLQYF